MEKQSQSPRQVYDILKVVLVTNDDVGGAGGYWTDGVGGEKQMIFPLLSSVLFQPFASASAGAI